MDISDFFRAWKPLSNQPVFYCSQISGEISGIHTFLCQADFQRNFRKSFFRRDPQISKRLSGKIGQSQVGAVQEQGFPRPCDRACRPRQASGQACGTVKRGVPPFALATTLRLLGHSRPLGGSPYVRPLRVGTPPQALWQPAAGALKARPTGR